MLLTELMEECGITVEDKRTGSRTLEKKEEDWLRLAERFNGSTGTKDTRDGDNQKPGETSKPKKMRRKRGGVTF
ncbi:hypothetical protein EYF80_059925 [Liparis tanakae]|uniref:Uncharacterized protein n=1 Tax=Liparis tanakae TaxID=230148 RepID=A0A4Z2EMD4_9TELE|nr:hypothetical protein EYF80_059925 [Liparis tanakae]